MRQEPYNTIRNKLRKLNRESIYPWRPEYGYGYHAAMEDALKIIRDVKRQQTKEE